MSPLAAQALFRSPNRSFILTHKKHSLRLGALAAAALALAAGAAQAASGPAHDLRGVADNRQLNSTQALIVSGGLPDTPAARIDANTAASPWSGVVSINSEFNWENGNNTSSTYGSFICSGALVSPTHIITAGHCIDRLDDGTPAILAGGVDRVRAVFNAGSAGGGNGIITAISVTMHPDYQGFGFCPAGVSGFCINDDIAVITLAAPAPAAAKIYRADFSFVDSATPVTHVGYGTAGSGDVGYTVGPNFRIKRTGGNHIDTEMTERNDEAGFAPGSAAEVWIADFDGTMPATPDVIGDLEGFQDTHCMYFGACSPVLANNVETTLGGGDSGGPSFKQQASGEWVLIGNNTFGTTWFEGQVDGTFGTSFGGMVLGGYESFLVAATDGAIQAVPEPATYGLMLAGLAALGAAARRRKV